MAVDTAQKRASATHFLTPNYTQLVLPDGTISAADRQAATLVYSGISAVEQQEEVTPKYVGFIVNQGRLMSR